jgi:cytochrome c biogenesis protein CcmG/thiol:disulfide interchange protein DsbE
VSVSEPDLAAPPAPPPAVRGLRALRLLGVVLLVLVALAVGLRDDKPRRPSAVAAQPEGRELAGLRAAASLPACPAGLGPALPDVVLPCLAGGPDVALASAPPGRPTLVNVWASWCGPCVDEVPALADLARRGGDRLGVLGVLTSDSMRSALAFADAYDMGYPSVVDDDGTILREHAAGPPVTLFLDAAGRLVHTERGAADVTELEALVAQHLGVRL